MANYYFTKKTKQAVEEALAPLDRWAHQCHAASLTVVKAGIFPEARVARGATLGVPGQHSWVVVGNDVYDPDAIVDPTLWSYASDVEGIVYTSSRAGMAKYLPHGHGSIWHTECPGSGGGEEIVLYGLSESAKRFLRFARGTNKGTLDIRFWLGLLSGPMGGWPAREIVTAAAKDRRLAPLIPIDILGHVTDLNPEGLYF